MAGILYRALAWLVRRFARATNFVIGAPAYLKRWHLLPRNRFCNLYLHKILRSDDDRALHDHPWANVSLVLAGGYIEVTPRGAFRRRPGMLVFRRASTAHRLVIKAGGRPCWTLFLTGPKTREWGFHCPGKGFVPWRRFTGYATTGDSSTIGPGCDG